METTTQSMLITVEELAAELRLSPAMIYKMLNTAQLPAPVRVGRRVRWRREEIAAWVAAGCPSRDVWETRRN